MGTNNWKARGKEIRNKVCQLLSNPLYCYFFLNLVCLAIIYIRLFYDLGSLRNFLFAQYIDITSDDTGMDFYNSLIYVSDRVPYTRYQTLYPPLANLCLWFLTRTVPVDYAVHWGLSTPEVIANRYTRYDPRLFQCMTMLFIAFIIISALSIYTMVLGLEKSRKRACLMGVSLLTSFGMIYAYERGNIIIIAIALTCFFVFWRNDDNKYIRELSYIALAIAAGLKLYPALFGVLLIRDKKIKEAVRTIIYGLAAFILPFFFFEGIEAMKIFFDVLFSFDSGAAQAYKLTTIVKKLVELALGRFMDVTAFTDLMGSSAAGILGVAVVALLLVIALFCKQEKDAYAAIFLATLFIQSPVDYALLFSLPCLIVVFKEKNIKDNIWYFVLISLVNLPFPLLEYNERLKLNDIQIAKEIVILALLIYVLVVAGKDVYGAFHKKNQIVEIAEES